MLVGSTMKRSSTPDPRLSLERRKFLLAALAAGMAIPAADVVLRPRRVAAAERRKSPNERLNLAVIGLGGQGLYDLREVSAENIVALCDVDQQRLDRAASDESAAKKFVDFRRVLDLDNLDGVVVATPDFSHAVVTVQALKRKLPVYSEKPLTKTIAELRRLLAVATESGVPTQTGNQIHAGANYRRAVDLVRAGVLGPVRRVYIWQRTTVKGMKLVRD